VSPAAEGGGIGQAVGIFERRRSFFPGAVLLKASPQGLTPSQQAVMRVRGRKGRKESKSLLASGAATATDPDPVVMLIVGLLAAASVADDRIAFTNGASPQDDVFTACGPVGFELVLWNGKWDKENRSSSGLCPGVDLPRLSRKRSPTS
jgi:hypothetical protein